MWRLRLIPHPDGNRRIVVLRRDDGLHRFIEEELIGEEWVPNERSVVAGLHGTAEDAEQDAVAWFAGHRTLH
mgnify:CR=1 FL=1